MSDNFKSFVGSILNLPESISQAWDILDLYPEDNPQLALAHYNDNFNPLDRSHEPLKRIRGVIVDLTTGAIVADSYGHTESLPCYEPLTETTSPDAPHGTMSMQTEIATFLNDVSSAPLEAAKLSFGTREFDLSKTKLYLGYEGAMVRLFKWNDEVFFSTHRRIDAKRSNWGGRAPFYQLYQELGGPEPESLFGDEDFSPFCHLFLVVDNRIRLATSTRDNRIIYLGVKKVWDEETYARMDETNPGPYAYYKDFKVRMPKFGTEPSAFSTDLNRALLNQPSIDVETANKFMFPSQYAARIPQTPETEEYKAQPNELIIDYSDNGLAVNEIYFPNPPGKIGDERLSGGDFVMLYTQTPQGETIVYRLEPAAFEYRVKITANDPNLYHRFVVEMVNFTKSNAKDLISEYPRYIGGDGKELQLDDPQSRQVYWWSLFYDAVAPAYKDEVDEFYSAYQKDINQVANFIISTFPKITDQEELKRINENTQKRFQNLRDIASSSARSQNRAPFGILRNLLYNETGPSFYKMISTIRNIQRYRASQKAESEAPVVTVPTAKITSPKS